MMNAKQNKHTLGFFFVTLLTVVSLFAVHGEQVPVGAERATSSGHTLEAGRVVLYAGVGPELAQYDVDVKKASLTKRASLTLPGNVQYAWPHPSKRYFYVAWSTGGPPTPGVNSSGGHHGLSAFGIDPVSGVLSPLGRSVDLPSRPIHVSVDIPGTHLLVAYNDPSGVTVHGINPDGTIGLQIKQSSTLDLGIYAHQVRVDPSDKIVILVTRGNGPADNKPEDPGALKIFGYNDGTLVNLASIAPGRGLNFQPRHIDFHPSRPWVFVSLERQNKIEVYGKLQDGTLSPAPLFIKDTVATATQIRPGQEAGTVHVNPSGKYVYVANRASGIADSRGYPVFRDGENSIAVFAVNQNTGEPTLVQSIGTRGMTPRTFALDPAAHILVAANQLPLPMGKGRNAKTVPPNLAVFRVRGDGRLNFVRTYDVHAPAAKMMFWMGLVPLP